MTTLKQLAESILKLTEVEQEEEAIFLTPWDDASSFHGVSLSDPLPNDLVRDAEGDEIEGDAFDLIVVFINDGVMYGQDTYTVFAEKDTPKKMLSKARSRALELSEESQYYDPRIPDLQRKTIVNNHDVGVALVQKAGKRVITS